MVRELRVKTEKAGRLFPRVSVHHAKPRQGTGLSGVTEPGSDYRGAHSSSLLF